MRSECAHKAEHTLQKHVKESVKPLLTLGSLQHTAAGKRKVQFVNIKEALRLKSRDFVQGVGMTAAACFQQSALKWKCY